MQPRPPYDPIPCQMCGGTGRHVVFTVVLDPGLDDLMDKTNDIKEKVDEIKEVVDEIRKIISKTGGAISPTPVNP